LDRFGDTPRKYALAANPIFKLPLSLQQKNACSVLR
jgi:hypothetical protein